MRAKGAIVTVAYRAKRIVDGISEHTIEDGAVIVEGASIVSVVPGEDIPSGAPEFFRLLGAHDDIASVQEKIRRSEDTHLYTTSQPPNSLLGAGYRGILPVSAKSESDFSRGCALSANVHGLLVTHHSRIAPWGINL